MYIKIKWFKSSGKWYSNANHTLNATEFHEAISEFKTLVASGKRPGLVNDVNNKFDACVKFYTQHGPLHALFVNGKNFRLEDNY